MTSDERREFLRRMSVGLGAVAVAACGGGGGSGANSAQMPAETPAPTVPGPVALAPDPGSIPAPPAGAPVFRLSGGTGENVLLPFCLGQVFRPGAFPRDAAIGCGLGDFQASVLNRWPDGSAKFAVLAGRAAVAPGATRSLTLSVAASAPAGANVTEAQLQQSGLTAILEFAPHGSVQLQSLIGVASRYDSARKRWTAGMVRQNIAGPQMSSWTYYAPIGGHPHLAAWFEVRCWASGQVQVLPWIENGYLNVAGPASVAGTLAFTLNGTQRFSAEFTLPARTRTAAIGGAPVAYWADGGAGLQFSHDTAYWQLTGLVPTYMARAPSTSKLLARQKTAFAPLMQGDFPAGMGAGGYHPSIGMLPEWDVAYLISNGDARAQAAVLAHGLAAGRYPLHYRDETTNQPLRFSSYSDLGISGGSALGVPGAGTTTTGQYTPAPTGAAPPTWASSHHPSVGYLAYLVSGWSYFAEQLQFAATLNFLKQGNMPRGRSKGLLLTNVGANTTRGAAWALRTLLQAATVTPDAQEPLRSEFLASLAANVDDYHQKYVAQANNPFGVCAPYGDYTAGDGKHMHAIWMEDFLTAAWGYALSLRLPLDGAVRNRLEAFFQWKARSIVGRFGRPGVPTEYNYLDAAQYTMAVAASDMADFATGRGPWFADWGAIYAATLNRANDVGSGDQLRGAYFPDPSSYWGNLQPALSYAVDHGVPGATAAYARMTSARNWPQFVANCDATPVWSVRPLIGV